MNLIKPDYDRRLVLPGVPDPVRRPVDVDQSQTGFANLRTLRIYQFDAESAINGHAEEDEVFIVVLAGRIELTVSEHSAEESSRSFTLAAPSDSNGEPSVAYLPPHAAYQLISKLGADIAYARATPVDGLPPAVFSASYKNSGGVTVLLDEATYAQRLRLRLLRFDAAQDVEFSPVKESEEACEALVHIRTGSTEQVSMMTDPDAAPILLGSWDTIALAPGERPNLCIPSGTRALIFIVLAL